MHRAVAVCAILITTTPVRADPTQTPAPTQPTPVRTVHTGEKPPIGLSGGAPSIDALLDQFLAAVKAGDSKALIRLRVTKEEYGNIIVPGEVPKGQPPRATYEKVNDVFYGMLDSRSQYYAQELIHDFKDREFVKREVELTKGTREFAWYTGHGEVKIRLTDPQGQVSTLRTGWIAEVDGRFKFIGYNWDD
jgi:hypothetical protein